jgi:hypothetical protein
MRMFDLPMPPRNRYRLSKPMLVTEARYWIASYNAWVAIWNRHERDTNLELAPPWAEAWFVSFVFCGGRSVLGFKVRTSGHLGLIRLRGWSAFERGSSMCRQPAAIDQVAWAGWNK